MSEHKKKHKVHLFHWEGNVLKKFEHWFEDFLEALEFANCSGVHSVKIYNERGDIVHSGKPCPRDHYA